MDVYLGIDEFSRYERMSEHSLRKQIKSYPEEKIIPALGQGKRGKTLLHSSLLSEEGMRRFLACPAVAHTATALGQAMPAPIASASCDTKLAELNADQRETALFWHSTLNDFDRLLSLRPDWSPTQAAQQFLLTLPQERQCSERAFLDKYRRWKRAGISGVAPKPKSGRPSAAIHPKLQSWLIDHYVNKTQGRSRRLSANAGIAKARREGWQPCPSRTTLERMLRNVPGNVLFGAKGKKALDDHILPSTLRDYSEAAMWLAVGDHHRFDVFVRCKDGRVRRLWCTMWLDHRSRMALGWQIGETPSSRTIAESFRRMVLRYGAPEVVEIDNGADYVREQLIGSRWQTQQKRVCSDAEGLKLKGAFEACGVKRVVRAIVKNAKSKLVERFFETMEAQLGKGLPGYCGKDPVERKKIEEALGHPVEQSPNLLSEEEFEQIFARWIEENYHQNIHSGEGMNGRSPAQCFKDEVQEVARPPKENLDLLFLEPVKAVMQRNGFKILGQWYRNPELQHAHFNPETSTKERTYIARYDRQDLSEVRIYSRKDSFLGVAARVSRSAYDSEEEIKRRKHEHKQYKKKRDAFWEAQEQILEHDMTIAEQIGLAPEAAAVANDSKPSGGFAKVVRYVMKAVGGGDGQDGKQDGQVVSLQKKKGGRETTEHTESTETPAAAQTQDDIAQRIAARLAEKQAGTRAAAQDTAQQSEDAAARIAARLKNRFYS